MRPACRHHLIPACRRFPKSRLHPDYHSELKGRNNNTWFEFKIMIEKSGQ
jgi:hypothetical protein